MSASEKRIITVVGGTGNIGKAVVAALQESQLFHVRVTSRDPATGKAKEFADSGIEVVKADSWNPKELDAAFKGCWGLWVNTNSDDINFKNEVGPPESEMGRIIIDAAIRQGVDHFVFQNLPAASKITNGEVPILSFDNKETISDYAKAAGFKTTTNVNLGWVLEVFWLDTYVDAFGGLAKKPDEEGFLSLKVPPMGNDPEVVPWTAVEHDYGDAVLGVFIDPEPWADKTVWAISDPRSFQDLVDAYNKVSGTKRARRVIPEGALKTKTQGKTKEVNGLFGYCHWVKGNYCGNKPVDLTDMKTLKALGAKARGRTGKDAELQTVEEFWAMTIPRYQDQASSDHKL
ncbi:NmrA domain-containing protein [Fusarium keratoplasticum]|uniref:NmrA domain-containing protein n=1 Tax=Fusarium keratoplasticum TaxID=1328300 RepID=A0ACC0QXX7_9HYPO|nr:NmrA domain-containing protein [Fusarium keratoplasticum]KAI8670466.1 NmrA domain-containing protein [Fusarium keratoplasticum]